MYLIPTDDMPLVALDVEESVHHALGVDGMWDWEHYVDAHAWFKLCVHHTPELP